jgi:type II secretory pathway component PulK
MTETAFVAIAALMVALLVVAVMAVGIVAAHAAWRVCRRDWAAQATGSTRNRA